MADEQLLSAVLEPRRREILRVLAAEGGLAVGKLATRFDVSRPAISQHLAVLRDAGLVDMRSERGRNTYSVVPARIDAARSAVAALATDLPGMDAEADAAPPEPVEPPAAAPSAPPPDVALEAFAAAPPERVFAVAATVAGQALWLGRADADATPGGRFHVDLGGDAAAGTYFEVAPPARLAFGWGQEGSSAMAPDSSRVDLVFTPSGDGTRIRLEHRGLPAVMHAPHLASWAHHLPRLAEAATA